MSGAITHQHLAFIGALAAWFAVGALLGFVHFVSLRWNVQCLVSGRAVLSLVLQLLRLALTGAALVLTVRQFGAVALLAGSLGLLAARSRVLLVEAS